MTQYNILLNIKYYSRVRFDRNKDDGIGWSGSYIKAASQDVANCRIMTIRGNLFKTVHCFYATRNISTNEPLICYYKV